MIKLDMNLGSKLVWPGQGEREIERATEVVRWGECGFKSRGTPGAVADVEPCPGKRSKRCTSTSTVGCGDYHCSIAQAHDNNSPR